MNLQDNMGWIPLFEAMLEDNWRMVVLLLDSGSDLSLTTVDGETAIHILVDQDDAPFAQRAILKFAQEGIDLEVCAKEGERTALARAASTNNVRMFKTLVKAGANVNTEIAEKKTVLDVLAMMSHFSKEQGVTRMLEIALRAGAYVDGLEPSFSSPLDAAVFTRNFPVAKMLVQANSSGRISRDFYFLTLTSFMTYATACRYDDIARFIFGDACSSGMNRDLQEKFYQLSLTEDATVLDQTIQLARPPVPLERLCRLAVRATLPKGPPFWSAVDKLPLPDQIKAFIILC